MTTRTRLIIGGGILLACFVGWNGLAQRLTAQQSNANPGESTEPLILVIHGVGSDPVEGVLGGQGGNRLYGWSADVAKAWGMGPVQEITFRYPGRTIPDSFTDFARTGGAWAKSVQDQIQAAVRKNPGRRVVIVSHSWGTVAAKIALMGGTTRDYGDLSPIQGVSVDEWVTLGSPLGRADANVAFNLRQITGDIADGRPPVVKHWTNFYDPADRISLDSHNLPGAENVAVYWRPAGLFDYEGAHTKIWTNENVIKRLRTTVAELGKKPRTAEDAIAQYEKERLAPPPPAPSPAAARCEADFQEQLSQISATTLWNISGLASWSDGCPAAESRFTSCYQQTCQMYRDSGIYNDCTEKCTITYKSACTAENIGIAATQRDECVAGRR